MLFRFTRILTLAAACVAALGASAQVSLSPAARLVLENYRNNPDSRAAESTVLSLVEFDDPAAVDSLRSLGIDVRTTFGSFAIIALPLDRFDNVSAVPGLRSMEFGTEATPTLDKARAATGADEVHAGTSIARPYTGKDVIVGVVDQGLDPLHPSFMDAEGNPRVKMFALLASGKDVRKGYTLDEISRMRTDIESESHGTHVTGIAAGSRGLRADVPVTTTGENGKTTVSAVREGDLPFYGVAPEADIVMAGGGLQISEILLLASDIIDYAKEQGKPAVINMSLGINIGPHNGTGAFSRAVAELGKDAIFSISAGNEGDANITIDHVIADRKPLQTAIDMSRLSATSSSEQVVEIHATEGSGMKVYVAGFNKFTRKKEFSIRVQSFNADGTMKPFSMAQLTKFNDYFTGKPQGGTGRSSDDGTDMACIYFKGVSPKPGNSNVVLGLEVQAADGTRVLAFANSPAEPFYTAGIPDLTAGTPAMSISDMATGENIISVGAFNTRSEWAAIDKGVYSYNGPSVPYLEPSFYSSYGRLTDGRERPHISAPGTYMISSLSRYYTATGYKEGASGAAIRGAGLSGADAFYGEMHGTSMAAPFITGTVALWLEADPTLTVADVIDVMDKTAVKDDTYYKGNNALRMGAGRIDVLAGIKEVLVRRYGTGIGAVAADTPEAIITADGAEASAFFAGASSVSIDITTPSGVSVASARAEGAEARVATAGLAPGIYIVSARADGHRSASRKIRL